jgi:hypothetical protein
LTQFEVNGPLGLLPDRPPAQLGYRCDVAVSDLTLAVTAPSDHGGAVDNLGMTTVSDCTITGSTADLGG